MIPPTRPFQSGARYFQAAFIQRAIFCIFIGFLLSMPARSQTTDQIIETYAHSQAEYYPPLYQPNDPGIITLDDRHLAAVPSATSILLAGRGIVANASAKLKSLA